jgi:hypothetical protein
MADRSTQNANSAAIHLEPQVRLDRVAWFAIKDADALRAFNENQEVIDVPQRVEGTLVVTTSGAPLDLLPFDIWDVKPPPRDMAFRINAHDDLIQLGRHWSEAEVGSSTDDKRLREHLAEEARQLWVDGAARLVLDGPASSQVIKGLLRRAHAYRHGLLERDGSSMSPSRDLLVRSSWFLPPPVVED